MYVCTTITYVLILFICCNTLYAIDVTLESILCDFIAATNIESVISKKTNSHGTQWHCGNNHIKHLPCNMNSTDNHNSWMGISCVESAVSGIDLSNMGLVGSIPDTLGYITSLQSLNLSHNGFMHTIPATIAYQSPTGSHSGTIGHSHSLDGYSANAVLHSVDLSHNNLVGWLPHSLICALASNVESFVGGMSALHTIILAGNKLSGTLPEYSSSGGGPEAGNVRYTHCWKSIANISVLDLSDNSMTGDIPTDIVHMTRLESLKLNSNWFTGAMPRLGSIKLGHGGHGGTVVGVSLTLKTLDLSDNKLRATIPNAFQYLSALKYMNLSYNSLTGHFPTFLGANKMCDSLTVIDVQHNGLMGSIPPHIINCHAIQELHVNDNRILGRIPATLHSLSKMQHLNMSRNRLSHAIPNTICQCTSLITLNVKTNHLVGSIPSCIGDIGTQLKVLRLDDNSFNDNGGELPLSLLELHGLEVLSVAKTELSGNFRSFEQNPDKSAKCTNIGSCLPNLKSLNLELNDFSGPLPTSISLLKSLTELYVNDNGFTGSIPSFYGDLINMHAIDVGDNELTNKIPDEFGKLVLLTKMYLNNNKLNGTLPSSLHSLHNMQQLDVSTNQLSGTLPSYFHGNVNLENMYGLETLYLGFNQFSGIVTDSLCTLSYLKKLTVNDNRFICYADCLDTVEFLTTARKNLRVLASGARIDRCSLHAFPSSSPTSMPSRPTRAPTTAPPTISLPPTSITPNPTREPSRIPTYIPTSMPTGAGNSTSLLNIITSNQNVHNAVDILEEFINSSNPMGIYLLLTLYFIMVSNYTNIPRVKTSNNYMLYYLLECVLYYLDCCWWYGGNTSDNSEYNRDNSYSRLSELQDMPIQTNKNWFLEYYFNHIRPADRGGRGLFSRSHYGVYTKVRSGSRRGGSRATSTASSNSNRSSGSNASILNMIHQQMDRQTNCSRSGAFTPGGSIVSADSDMELGLAANNDMAPIESVEELHLDQSDMSDHTSLINPAQLVGLSGLSGFGTSFSRADVSHLRQSSKVSLALYDILFPNEIDLELRNIGPILETIPPHEGGILGDEDDYGSDESELEEVELMELLEGVMENGINNDERDVELGRLGDAEKSDQSIRNSILSQQSVTSVHGVNSTTSESRDKHRHSSHNSNHRSYGSNQRSTSNGRNLSRASAVSGGSVSVALYDILFPNEKKLSKGSFKGMDRLDVSVTAGESAVEDSEWDTENEEALSGSDPESGGTDSLEDADVEADSEGKSSQSSFYNSIRSNASHTVMENVVDNSKVKKKKAVNPYLRQAYSQHRRKLLRSLSKPAETVPAIPLPPESLSHLSENDIPFEFEANSNPPNSNLKSNSNGCLEDPPVETESIA